VTRKLIDYSTRALLLTGSAALAWVGYAWWDASRLQRIEDPVPVLESTAPRFEVPAIHAGDPIGRLSVPRLGLSVRVLEGADSGILRVAAGHVSATGLPGTIGNTVIAAHRDTFFRPLRAIRADDTIVLTVSGSQLRYRVKKTEIVGPGDVQVLNPTADEELTLITCYPFYYVGPAPKRFIVHARRD
jgi:sortase A